MLREQRTPLPRLEARLSAEAFADHFAAALAIDGDAATLCASSPAANSWLSVRVQLQESYWSGRVLVHRAQATAVTCEVLFTERRRSL